MDRREIIKEFGKQRKAFYRDVARRMRTCKGVNIYKIERLSKNGDVIVVPGRVIGDAKMSKKVKIYAYAFSKSAGKSIKDAKGTTHSMEELLKAKEMGRIII